jgi:hypothetical protein
MPENHVKIRLTGTLSETLNRAQSKTNLNRFCGGGMNHHRHRSDKGPTKTSTDTSEQTSHGVASLRRLTCQGQEAIAYFKLVTRHDYVQMRFQKTGTGVDHCCFT